MKNLNFINRNLNKRHFVCSNKRAFEKFRYRAILEFRHFPFASFLSTETNEKLTPSCGREARKAFFYLKTDFFYFTGNKPLQFQSYQRVRYVLCLLDSRKFEQLKWFYNFRTIFATCSSFWWQPLRILDFDYCPSLHPKLGDSWKGEKCWERVSIFSTVGWNSSHNSFWFYPKFRRNSSSGSNLFFSVSWFGYPKFFPLLKAMSSFNCSSYQLLFHKNGRNHEWHRFQQSDLLWTLSPIFYTKFRTSETA